MIDSSDYSKLNHEVLSDNRFAVKRKNQKLNSGAFHFRRQTERASPRTATASAMGMANYNIMSATARSKKHSLGVPEPGTFLYLGQAGESCLYSERSVSKKLNNKRRIRKQREDQAISGADG